MRSPPRSEPIVKIHLQASRACATYLIALHLLGFTAAATTELAWPLIAAVAVALALSLRRELRRNQALEVLIQTDTWTVRYTQGPDFVGHIAGIDANTDGFISLRLSQPQGRRSLLIFRDACSLDSYRRLRRHLMTHRAGKAVDDQHAQP